MAGLEKELLFLVLFSFFSFFSSFFLSFFSFSIFSLKKKTKKKPCTTLIWSLGSEFGERDGSNLSWAGSYFGEDMWPHPGLEFGSEERNPGSAGSKLREKNGLNLGLAGF